tara:strand:+ start:2905 stop:4080 length:1176 start_codon:yes stop_codon:yes gene_type:complete
MGNPFKKIFSGIAKVFRKIGRGIKKVAKKIGSFVGKFGIVGQLGMFMLMPHIGSWIWKGMLKMAPGVLGTGAAAGSVAGATGTAAASTAGAAATMAAPLGTATAGQVATSLVAGSTGATAQAGLTAASAATVGNVGQLASALSTGNIVQRTAGLIMKGAHLTGRAYSGITSMIDQGVSWVKDTGSKIFGRGNEAKMVTDEAIGKNVFGADTKDWYMEKYGVSQPSKPFPNLRQQAMEDTFGSYGYTPPVKHTIPPTIGPGDPLYQDKLNAEILKTVGSDAPKKTVGEKAGEKALEFTRATAAAAFEEGVNPPVRDDDDYGTSMWVGPMHTPELTQAHQNDFMLAQGGHPYGNNSYVQHMNQIFGTVQDSYFSWLNGIPMIPSARGNQYSTA